MVDSLYFAFLWISLPAGNMQGRQPGGKKRCGFVCGTQHGGTPFPDY
jgi:hypothetical protein